ncbi:hypothetical protein [Micromonospora sp. WMMD975]|uniref:hypothetical protein n=1 Tax=Micromonospora sp. WMMD975 TaxID=3016087 RepID=UPI00249B37DB|nr:hypothetical protein [Micromonospora sp. WMMD975]WFE33993.1 hypothetical protein O7613_00905 [Micromonospora sp. WMMD975]
MAEDEITQAGIRVGGWLPDVPVEPPATPPPPAGPRRLPGDPDLAATEPEPTEPEPTRSPPVGPALVEPPLVGPSPIGPPLVGPAAGGAASSDPGRGLSGGPGSGLSGGAGSGLSGPGSGHAPLVGPAPIGLDVVGPAPGRRTPGSGRAVSREAPARPRPAGGYPFKDGGGRPATPGRHTAPESLRTRLVGLTGPLATRLRAASSRLPRGRRPAARPASGTASTRVGAARVRRRRRRVLLATAALTVSVVALAYSARSPAPEHRRSTAPVAAPTVSTQPPTAAPPTVVPVTGDPALPGGPLLNLDQQSVPPSVSLTLLGTRDWRHWGGSGADSVQRKQRGTGEIEDPGGERLEHNAGVSGLSWTDGTPVARQEGTRAGVFQRGAGKRFTLAVAGSGDLRTVRLFVGVFSAGARLDVSLSGGGDPAVREVALARGDQFYQYVVHFRAPRGERLLISWRALSVTGGQNDGVSLEAITVS